MASRNNNHVLDVLASAIRREILWLTWSDELTAGEIAERFEISAPTVSQHLRVLRDAELVSMVADGNFRRYRARRDRLSSLEPYLREGEFADWVLSSALRPAGAEVEVEAAHLARAKVNVDLAPDRAFEHFVQADLIEKWCGENAASEPRDGGRFQFDAMGRTCRGVYWRFHPPSMLILHWGFSDTGDVPAPSDLFETIISFSSSEAGTDVEIMQPASSAEVASLLGAAWADRLRYLRDVASPENPNFAR